MALRRRLGLLPDSTRVHPDAVLPAWLRRTGAENRIPVVLAVVVAIALQVTLPSVLTLPDRHLLPALEALLLIALSIANPVRMSRDHAALRVLSTALVVAMSLANAASAALLADQLVTGAFSGNAQTLLVNGASIYLTNIIVFGLWFWEYDRGGPFARQAGQRPHGDFLFPQMAVPEIAHDGWEPRFVDYLYVSFTNATAFSPTDTMPLSRWAKSLMAVQSLVSLVTVALVVARAVNILK